MRGRECDSRDGGGVGGGGDSVEGSVMTTSVVSIKIVKGTDPAGVCTLTLQDAHPI